METGGNQNDSISGTYTTPSQESRKLNLPKPVRYEQYHKIKKEIQQDSQDDKENSARRG